jgi:hypothetical protein
MGDLVLKGATSGQITLTPTGVAGTNTLTLPARTGNIITSADSGTVTQTMLSTNVVGNGPAFSAANNTNQSITTGVATKVTLSVEEFDTNNNFSSSRFTPTVAGYYNITGYTYASATSQTYGYVMIYRNGSIYQGGIFFTPFGASISTSVASVVMYLNGSSDFVELYVQSDGTSPSVVGTSAGFEARLSGALVRAA